MKCGCRHNHYVFNTNYCRGKCLFWNCVCMFLRLEMTFDFSLSGMTLEAFTTVKWIRASIFCITLPSWIRYDVFHFFSDNTFSWDYFKFPSIGPNQICSHRTFSSRRCQNSKEKNQFTRLKNEWLLQTFQLFILLS